MRHISLSANMNRHSDVNWAPRNILSLEQRIKVIREYDRRPVYQKIANTFQCSTKQIKNIIANRESILMSYVYQASNGSSGGEAKRQRHKKITFLGKVMYEYVQRAQRQKKATPLTPHNIRCKALEVKEIIKVPNFYPNNAWMNNFKTEYKITDFDLSTMRTDIAHREACSLDINDIISHVSNSIRKQRGNHKENSITDSSYGFDLTAQYDYGKGGSSGGGGGGDGGEDGDGDISDAGESGPMMTYGEISDYDVGNTLNNNGLNVVNLESDDDDGSNTSAPPSTNQKVESIASSEPADVHITSYADALRYLKPLEDFALLEENYRAIGLISQLDSVLKNAPKRSQP